MSESTEPIPQTYCIFQQPWWLEAAAPGSWDAVEIRKSGQLQARLPYMIKRKMGLTLLMMPPLTQTLGPWFADMPGKYATRLSKQKKLYQKLYEQLPPFDYYKHHFHYKIDNWLPLHWEGFEQTTRYTYVLEELSDLDTIWNGFEGSTRREIRKARDQLEISREDDPRLMWKMHRKTFERQDEEPGTTFNQFKRIDEACKRREARTIFVARDAQNRVHGSLYLVWDRRSAYYLMGGADPELRTSGVSSLLMWRAIQFASEVTQRFDFEGSMIEPIERFFRGFGARQKPYFRVTKMSRRMRLLMNARDTFRNLLRS
ncbi:MAG: GNAT family N-acetyltransferase [Balneolaceae bacterium]|nr:GNAT family N-acetyltransferase [Balneolaceae bacterium]